MKKIIIIAGPTASGKSAFAASMAKKNAGTVINADSMQIYDALPILTAQPEKSEDHKLYGILKASDSCSVAKWLDLAIAEIEKSDFPIVTGGTGLYINSVIHGISAIPAISESIRDEIRDIPKSELYPILLAEDKEMAQKLKPSDSQRIARALEVIRSTGKSLQYWQKQPKIPKYPFELFEIHNIIPEREMLYKNINQRFLEMLKNGVVEEVRNYHGEHKAAGFIQIKQYIAGEISKQFMIEKATQVTRNYAKRQYTWFRNQL